MSRCKHFRPTICPMLNQSTQCIFIVTSSFFDLLSIGNVCGWSFLVIFLMKVYCILPIKDTLPNESTSHCLEEANSMINVQNTCSFLNNSPIFNPKPYVGKLRISAFSPKYHSSIEHTYIVKKILSLVLVYWKGFDLISGSMPCNTAAFYIDDLGVKVCKLLACFPAENCLWAMGTPGHFAGFVK